MPLTLTQITDLLTPIVQGQEAKRRLGEDEETEQPDNVEPEAENEGR